MTRHVLLTLLCSVGMLYAFPTAYQESILPLMLQSDSLTANPLNGTFSRFPYSPTAESAPFYRQFIPYRRSAGAPLFRAGGRYYLISKEGSQPLHELRFLSRLQLSGHASLSYAFDSRNPAATPVWYQGSWGDWHAGTRCSWLHWQRNSLELDAGRFFFATGPHWLNGLLFSTRRALDGYHLRYSPQKLSGLRLSSFYFQLDDWQENGKIWNRYVSGHRIGWEIPGRFGIALTEAFLHGGEAPWTPPLSVLNPFLPYHSVQMNGLEGNTFLHLGAWYRQGQWLLTAEGLLDDFQIDDASAADQEPAEYGLILQALWTTPRKHWLVTTNYTRVSQRTYNAPLAWERWIYHNRPLAHALGSDFDSMLFSVAWNGFRWAQPRLEISHVRQGERTLNNPWDAPWLETEDRESYTESFPTGVVTSSWSQHWQVQGRYGPFLGILHYENAFITNHNHISGREAHETSWRFELLFMHPNLIQLR